MLYDNGIRAVVDLAINEKPAELGRELICCRFPINDGDGNPDWLIAIAIKLLFRWFDMRSGRLWLVARALSHFHRSRRQCLRIAIFDECLMELIDDAPNDVSPILWTHIKRVYNR
ncbi:MAG: hypothetical protein U0905_17805 [Pirellulales bacterium]